MVGVPSYNEFFGLVALEAQACGRTVVATDVGGLRHTVRDQVTGLLVPGQDVEAWAGALGMLLDDESERHRDGGPRGRTRVELQLGQHGRRDPGRVRSRARRTPVADAEQSGQRRGAAIGRHSG